MVVFPLLSKKYLTFMLVLGSIGLSSSVLASPPPLYPVIPLQAPSPKANPFEIICAPLFGSAKFGMDEIRTLVEDTLHEKASVLNPYYPTRADKDAFVKRVQNAFRTKVGKVNSVSKGILAAEVVASAIGADITEHVIRAVTPSSPLRIREWSERMRQDLNSCLRATKTIIDAKNCAYAFADVLPLNIGLATTHEVIQDQLLAHSTKPALLSTAADNTYRKCIGQSGGAHSNIELCARGALAASITQVASEQLHAKLAPHFKNKDRLRKTLSTLESNFSQCIQDELVLRKENKTGATVCLDKLVLESGTRAIDERIHHEPRITDSFSPSEISELASRERTTFSACLARQKKKNSRKGAILNIEPCIDQITNQVIYTVLLESVRQTAYKTFSKHADTPAAIAQATQQTNAVITLTRVALDSCWSDSHNVRKREACVKKSVLAASAATGSALIDSETDAGFHASRPQAKKKLLSQLDSCLDQTLSATISESPTLDADIESCAGPMRRSAALEVADYSFQNYLKGHLPDADVHSLTQRQLAALSQCLGPSPSEQTMSRCAFAAKRDGAIAVAQARFPVEVEKLLPKPGSHEEGQEFKERSQKEILKINGNFKDCIHSNLREDSPANLNLEIDKCLKDSIKEITFFVADLRLNQRLAALYDGRHEELTKLKQDISGELLACITKSEHLATDPFIQKVTTCGKDITERTILYVTRDQLRNILEQIRIKENPTALNAAASNEALSDCAPAGANLTEMTELSHSVMLEMGNIIETYIDYDLQNAKKDAQRVLDEVEDEIKSMGDVNIRSKLLDWLLHKTTALNQLLKAVVREQAITTLNALPKEDRLNPKLLARLTDKETTDILFDSPRGKEIIDAMAKTVLEPVILGRSSPKDPEIKQAISSVISRVKTLMVDSDTFGTALIDGTIQDGINKKVPFIVRKIDQGIQTDIFNWNAAKHSPLGMKAEAYIRESLIRPLTNGEPLSPIELKKRKAYAHDLVMDALFSRERLKKQKTQSSLLQNKRVEIAGTR